MARSDTKPDKGDPNSLKVDAALHLQAEKTWADDDNRPRWDLMKVPIEFKASVSKSDLFDDDLASNSLQTLVIKRQNVQGQLIHYTSKVFQEQHRTCVFSVIIMGLFARIVRWDRSGAVVTSRFNYVEEPTYLGNFFWRFSHASADDQGYDPSAELIPVGSDDYRLMDKIASKKLEEQDYARQYFKESLRNPASGLQTRRWMLPVRYRRDDKRKVRYFLVGRPFFVSSNIIGRGTRVFIALESKTNKLYCLKDTWRVDHTDIYQEGEILRRLNELQIEYVPTLYVHGDVDDQHTFTDKLWEKLYSDDKIPFRKHTHYRIVEVEVCRPLSDFKNGRELLEVIDHCVNGKHR